MDCEIVDDIQRPSSSSTKKRVPPTPRNRRRAYIQNVDGDGNCLPEIFPTGTTGNFSGSHR